MCIHFRIDAEAIELWKKLDEKKASRVQSTQDPEKVTEKTAVAIIEVWPLSNIL